MSSRDLILVLCLVVLQLLIACNPVEINNESVPCLLYIGNATTFPELWMYCDEQYSQLTETNGRVIDFSITSEGQQIYILMKNDEGGTDIWKKLLMEEEQQKIISCGSDVYDFLSIAPNGEFIASTQASENDRLLLFSTIDKKEVYSENGGFSQTDFSPNGKYLSYFDHGDGVVKILDVENLSITHVVKCDEDLMGSWSSDSNCLICGQRSFDGGIAGIEMFEFDIITGISEKIFSEISNSLLVTQPSHMGNSNYLVLIRSGYKGNTRQIQILNVNGKLIQEITSEQQYDHSSYAFEKNGNQIAYQKYKVTSSNSLPEVWIWDSTIANSRFVASDAVRPIWMH